MSERVDIAIVGAGAAGLMAAIAAGREAGIRGSGAKIVAFDGASRLGAKILVAGGGRCNVTHHAVSETDYAAGPGSSLNAVRNVLRALPVDRTVEFFAELGVQLKREETGKLFPVTDDAHTVLDALLRGARNASVEIRHPWRVEQVESTGGGFLLSGGAGEVAAGRVVIATGGKSLPRTGSDGAGFEMVRALGHSVTRTFPALVPLLVDKARTFIHTLSGIATTAEVMVTSSSGKKLAGFTDSLLCTHFGLSGPAALNVSRHLAAARHSDSGASLIVNWLPGNGFEEIDAALVRAASGGRTILRALTEDRHLCAALPERLVRALVEYAGLQTGAMLGGVGRDARRGLARAITAMNVPVTGDRGYLFAEVTAGGVPLSEVRLDSMESRLRPGLHLCGEILDVDGRIGGFNFQWAWATGSLAGRGAARALGGDAALH